MIKDNLHKKDIVYFARIIPNVDIYEVCELVIRTIGEDYFVGIDKIEKHAYLFPYSDLDKIVFNERNNALDIVKKAENVKTKLNISKEIYYEEY